MKKNYDDIINLPHHVSDHHPRMSMSDRAAQFSPFAALTGYEQAVQETARRVDGKLEIASGSVENIYNSPAGDGKLAVSLGKNTSVNKLYAEEWFTTK